MIFVYVLRRRPRIRLYFSPRFKRKALCVALFILLINFLIMSFSYLRRVTSEMALSNAIDIVTDDINSAVSERMSGENMSYDRFVTLEKDSSGAITAIKANMPEINALSSSLLSDVVGRGDQRIIEVDIPFGNLLGSSFLMGKGPEIPLDIVMLTSSHIDFKNDLESTGINQTKHRIIFDIAVEIDVLIPWNVESATVEYEVIAAETVIVGGVPETYISLE